MVARRLPVVWARWVRALPPALALVLTGACADPKIPTNTPADQLPALIVSAKLREAEGDVVASRTDNGGSGGGGGGWSDPDSDRGGGGGVRDGGGGGGGGAVGGGGGVRGVGTLVAAAPQPASYALIIGIERYRDVPAASGARADAERFGEVARTTLGIPDENIRMLLDDRAGRTDITKQLRWLQSNVPSGGRIYLYFSGHGAPDPTSGVSYIVPYDGDPQYLADSAIKMSSILDELEKTKAKDVLAIADSCFSGAGGRSVLAPGTRPLVRVEEVKTTARVALLSASSGAEISGPTSDGKGGLFSHVLVEAIGSGAADINGDGQISLKEIDEWVRPRVSREARKANREQTPKLQLGKKTAADEFIVSWGYGK